MPCGRCRQVLYEFGGPDCLIDTPRGIVPLREVLPDAFGPDDLPARSDERRVRRIGTDERVVRRNRVGAMHAVDVIHAKRDGGRLTDEQIDWVVDAYTRGDVADEQMAALAMAILLNGMDAGEISRWTQAMIDSGERAGAAATSAGRRWTSTPPAGSATRSRCRSRRWWRRAGRRCRSCPGAGSGTPAAPWTSWSRSPAGGRRCRRTEIAAQLADVGAVICATTPDAGARRPQAVRAARRHRHRRVDPADRQLDHEQEDRGGDGGLVLDVKVGSGRVHEDARAGPRAGRDDGADRRRRTGCDHARCSPTCRCRWAGPSATRSRWPSRWRCCAAAARPTSWS